MYVAPDTASLLKRPVGKGFVEYVVPKLTVASLARTVRGLVPVVTVTEVVVDAVR